ncbi:hypothetical protein KKB64_02030 [Patescibacteria group bacterium]|nr:hypothetical protein [Patescibacteria group bacterium]MBU1472549.1 hypothetical protein [Patescibacteria group bacterium]MBU2460077.1 hypothetical protein [Patescibacteria group bacterium]MBU2544646.1 hypothetical protein [Patescibacteria group bacterium]
MNKNFTRILALLIILPFLMSACTWQDVVNFVTGQPAAATTPTPTVAPTATPQLPTSVPEPTATLPATPTQVATVPPSACREQMLGPWQPPTNAPVYDYIQINTEFLDSDYLVSLYYERDITLNGWQIQAGDGRGTEIVYTVRTSIKEVQFNDPRQGVAWRLCAHQDAQLASEAQAHAEAIATQRSWLRVYSVGDLWLSLQAGDAELIKLIKCITPSTQGIPDCHAPRP